MPRCCTRTPPPPPRELRLFIAALKPRLAPVELGEFLQSYYLAPGVAARVPMLAEEPPPFPDRRQNPLVGGIAEYLFKRWAPHHPPGWIKDRRRYLDRPWWPVGAGDPGLME